MRMSCNGCRVLRKGCSDSCSIRPCLQWINNPESQANATVFLAKFYGRAGLINLINAGPDHLRPAIFRSLLYEACGRMVNPIYGSVGLLWSGNWQLCQAAVEAVLKGDPIVQLPPGSAYDIRHANKLDPTQVARPAADLHKPRRTRSRFKRTSAASAARARGPAPSPPEEHESEQDRWYCPPMETTQFQRARSHDHESSASHATEAAAIGVDKEEESSMFSHVSQGEPVDGELGLELTLGFEPTPPQSRRSPGESSSPMDQMMTTGWENDDDDDDDSCRVRLGLELPPAASHHSKHDCTGDSSVN